MEKKGLHFKKDECDFGKKASKRDNLLIIKILIMARYRSRSNIMKYAVIAVVCYFVATKVKPAKDFSGIRYRKKAGVINV